VRVESRWDRKIEVGNALHTVMEDVANGLRTRQPARPIMSYRSRVEAMLQQDRYEAAEDLTLDDRARDIENVLRWAASAREYIADPGATMVRIEKYYPRHFDADAELGSVQMGAKADLVMRRQDARGPYIEIIDYKTGQWRRQVDFAPTLSRISHRSQIHALLPQQRFPRVVFTYLWLAREETTHIEFDYDYTLSQWRELRQVLRRMVTEEAWPMRPHPRTCRFCPYLNIACFPQAAPVPDPSGVDVSELPR
ncbi:MAG TPA: PD-(D/E)XK nuclease family protein, partial [Thermomicrobiales bacterium]|nr:PD-(D/E)XK nuclease family protein [Thermomicrobiales bacterium]